ncbi:MAG: hydrogenase expression/formation protein HypE [Parcubacteria group bacterium]|jgi:hydrogenase expression/formation protein HypE
MKQFNNVTMEMGGGGEKSSQLIFGIRKFFPKAIKWKNTQDDGAAFSLGKEKLVFTTDAFIVDPLFFPGGDIGKIAICGTINDLSVMGAVPIGISLSLVIEEGFPQSDLKKIMQSIGKISKETGVPIVTGDTKVTEKGKIDKIEITTSGVGLASKIIENGGAKVGDAIITSGNLGEHAVALLASRFNYRTKIKSDCQPVTKEVQSILPYLTSCKDPTRGGVAAVLNEMAEKSKMRFILDENNLPFSKETVALSGLLGIDKFSFPSEGRFVGTVPQKDAEKVLKILRKYNRGAKIIGSVVKGNGVYLKTIIGSEKKIEVPRGKLIPRIC